MVAPKNPYSAFCDHDASFKTTQLAWFHSVVEDITVNSVDSIYLKWCAESLTRLVSCSQNSGPQNDNSFNEESWKLLYEFSEALNSLLLISDRVRTTEKKRIRSEYYYGPKSSRIKF